MPMGLAVSAALSSHCTADQTLPASAASCMALVTAMMLDAKGAMIAAAPAIAPTLTTKVFTGPGSRWNSPSP